MRFDYQGQRYADKMNVTKMRARTSYYSCNAEFCLKEGTTQAM